jgi:hypothetical protein
MRMLKTIPQGVISYCRYIDGTVEGLGLSPDGGHFLPRLLAVPFHSSRLFRGKL